MQEADIAVGYLSINEVRRAVVDFSYPYSEEQFGFVMRKPSLRPKVKVKKAKKAKTNLTLLILVSLTAVPGCSLALWACSLGLCWPGDPDLCSSLLGPLKVPPQGVPHQPWDGNAAECPGNSGTRFNCI